MAENLSDAPGLFSSAQGLRKENEGIYVWAMRLQSPNAPDRT